MRKKAIQKNKDSSDKKEGDSEEKEDETDSNEKPGRYVFVRVDFDEALLGPKPVKPTEPEKPAALIESEKKGS